MTKTYTDKKYYEIYQLSSRNLFKNPGTTPGNFRIGRKGLPRTVPVQKFDVNSDIDWFTEIDIQVSPPEDTSYRTIPSCKHKHFLEVTLKPVEKVSEFEILHLVEILSPNKESQKFYKVALLNRKENNIYIRGVLNIRNHLEYFNKSTRRSKTNNKNFYLDLSNQDADKSFWKTLQDKIKIYKETSENILL